MLRLGSQALLAKCTRCRQRPLPIADERPPIVNGGHSAHILQPTANGATTGQQGLGHAIVALLHGNARLIPLHIGNQLIALHLQGKGERLFQERAGGGIVILLNTDAAPPP